jgi:carboxypeptidase Taq
MNRAHRWNGVTSPPVIRWAFFNAAVTAHPEIRSELAQGQFKTLRSWLEKNVHSKGSLLNQDQLFTAATGEPLNAAHFMNSLSRRYLGRDYTP